MEKNDDLKKSVGNRLKEARKQAGFTQSQIARTMSMTQQQYSRFENGIFELNYYQMSKLCTLLDVSADYLLGLKIY